VSLALDDDAAERTRRCPAGWRHRQETGTGSRFTAPATVGS